MFLTIFLFEEKYAVFFTIEIIDNVMILIKRLLEYINNLIFYFTNLFYSIKIFTVFDISDVTHSTDYVGYELRITFVIPK